MNCPACQNTMLTVEWTAVEIDYCPACEGIWLDRGELEALIGDADKASRILRGFGTDPASQRRDRPCPLCDVKMEKVVFNASKVPVVVDRCPKADGLWFDRGELMQILGSLGNDDPVVRFLADLFRGDINTH